MCNFTQHKCPFFKQKLSFQLICPAHFCKKCELGTISANLFKSYLGKTAKYQCFDIIKFKFCLCMYFKLARLNFFSSYDYNFKNFSIRLNALHS